MRISKKSCTAPDSQSSPFFHFYQYFQSFQSLFSGHAARFYILILLLFIAILADLCLGAVPIHLPDLFYQILAGEVTTETRIFLHVRLPRTLAAIFTGSALAASGTILQTVLNNNLAGPNIIGINAGAGFFVLLISALFPNRPAWIPAAAFSGALSASLIVTLIALKAGTSRVTLILSGVAIGSVFSAGSEAIAALFPDIYSNSRSFFTGGLSGVTLRQISQVQIYFIIGFLAALLSGRVLDILVLGGELAQSLGLRVNLARFSLLIIASLLAGASVSLAGLIGFVGLLVPHLTRYFFGPSHLELIPASMLTGALLVTICDLISRLLVAPYELPVGILLAFSGGPFFLWVLLRTRGRLYD